MPQLNLESVVKTEPGVSETDNMEEAENYNTRSTRKLRNRIAVLPVTTKKRKPPQRKAKAKAKQSKRAKKTKSAQRTQRGKHEPLYEERQHMLQNAQCSKDPEASENLITPEDAENRIFYTCKLCSKDFSSAFILCLHLQIHKKVGSGQSVHEENTAAADTGQSEKSLIKTEPYRDVTKSFDVSEADADESNTAARESPPVGILNKNFVESLKKNLSLAMKRQL